MANERVPLVMEPHRFVDLYISINLISVHLSEIHTHIYVGQVLYALVA